MEFYQQGVPLEEVNLRIAKFQAALLKKDIDAALIIQSCDLFYFSGTRQQGWLYVPAEGAPLLMIFKDYDRAKAESSMDTIVSLAGSGKIPDTLKSMGYVIPSNLGMELDVLPANLYVQYGNIFRTSRITDISMEVRMVRAVKSDFEIEQIRAAAKMSDRVAAKVPELLEPGKTEIALAGELESFARSLGHQGNIRMRLWGSELFYGHLMSGASAAVPSYLASPTGGYGTGPATPQGPGFKVIEKNEPILVDYVFALNGYLSDHTRIFSMGRLSDEFLSAHDAMLDIQDKTKEIAKPGTISGELYDYMVQKAARAGYGDGFMGSGKRKIRFTGHGIGLELDEFPFIARGHGTVLEKGMVIALEPKVIMPGKGVVGIENTFVVTENGLISLGEFPDAICNTLTVV